MHLTIFKYQMYNWIEYNAPLHLDLSLFFIRSKYDYHSWVKHNQINTNHQVPTHLLKHLSVHSCVCCPLASSSGQRLKVQCVKTRVAIPQRSLSHCTVCSGGPSLCIHSPNNVLRAEYHFIHVYSWCPGTGLNIATAPSHFHISTR